MTDAQRPGRRPKRAPSRKWSRDEILAAIRLWAEGHDGKPPRFTDWGSAGRPAEMPPSSAVLREFGKWGDAIEAAGFARPPLGGIPDPHLPALCRATLQEWEAGASVEELARKHGVSEWTINVRLRRANGEPPHVVGVRERVRRRAIHAGWDEGLSATEIAELLAMSPTHVTTIMSQMRAEGWDLPFKSAQPNREVRGERRPRARRRARRRWTHERILQAIIAHRDIHGEWPTSSQWRAKDPERRRPGAAIVRERFGNWESAITAAQLQRPDLAPSLDD